MEPIDPKHPPKEVIRWCKRLERVIKDCPSGVWIFAVDGGLCVMAYGEDGRRLVDETGMDRAAMVYSIHGPEIDGGDW